MNAGFFIGVCLSVVAVMAADKLFAIRGLGYLIYVGGPLGVLIGRYFYSRQERDRLNSQAPLQPSQF